MKKKSKKIELINEFYLQINSILFNDNYYTIRYDKIQKLTINTLSDYYFLFCGYFYIFFNLYDIIDISCYTIE